MTWLNKFIRPDKNRVRPNTYISQMSHWRIVGVHVFGGFFRELPNLVPAGSILYIENTGFWADVAQYLGGHAIAQPERKIERGTILPRPKYFHVPITAAVMSGLAEIAGRHAEPEVADHMVAYQQPGILLEWYDAGFDPIFVSKDIAEASVAAFCAKIGARYDELS